MQPRHHPLPGSEWNKIVDWSAQLDRHYPGFGTMMEERSSVRRPGTLPPPVKVKKTRFIGSKRTQRLSGGGKVHGKPTKGDSVDTKLKPGEVVFNEEQLGGIEVKDPKLLRDDQIKAIQSKGKFRPQKSKKKMQGGGVVGQQVDAQGNVVTNPIDSVDPNTGQIVIPPYARSVIQDVVEMANGEQVNTPINVLNKMAEESVMDAYNDGEPITTDSIFKRVMKRFGSDPTHFEM